MTGPKSSKQKNSSPTSKNRVPNDTRDDKKRDYKQKSSKSNSPDSKRVASQNGKNFLCQKAGPTNLTKPKSVVKKSHSGFKDHSSPPTKVPKKQDEEVDDRKSMSTSSS